MKINTKPAKKEFKESVSKKLGSYSIAASALIAINPSANADVVYTDIADVTIDTDGGIYNLDLNNDGTIDFSFEIEATSSTSYGNLYLENEIPIDAPTGNSYYATNSDAAAMNINAPINSALNWSTGVGKLAYYDYQAGVITTYGNWLGASNKYLGLKFKINGQTHYGWARLDVAADAGSFTIKDYAYEINVGQEILAGQTTPAGITDDLLANKVSLYGYGNTININFQNGDIMEGSVTVVNTLGQEIHKTEINDSQMQITINDPKGNIYLTRIELNNEAVLNRKVYLKNN